MLPPHTGGNPPARAGACARAVTPRPFGTAPGRTVAEAGKIMAIAFNHRQEILCLVAERIEGKDKF